MLYSVVCIFSFGAFQLPFGEDDDVTLSPPQFSQHSGITCHDLAPSFVNLELGQVKIDTSQQVTLHICTFVKLLIVRLILTNVFNKHYLAVLVLVFPC